MKIRYHYRCMNIGLNYELDIHNVLTIEASNETRRMLYRRY